jgi:UDP-glucuronate 4-epimerase
VEGVIRVLDRVPKPNPAWTGEHPDSATSAAPYQLYNIGNHHPVELMDYIRVLENCLGREAEKNMLPLQAGDVPDTYADVEDLVRDTGYKPDTSVDVGVSRFVDWYRSYYRL